MTTRDPDRVHPYIPKLVDDLEARRIGRRDFLRTATLLGLAAPTAYGIVGKVFGPDAVPAALAQERKKGGILRISMRIPELKNPAVYDFIYDSNVARQVNDYLTKTGHDNITRPALLEKWEASEDLKTWTLTLRDNVLWNNGEKLVADHIMWNLTRLCAPETGSSFLGLVKGYLVKDFDTGEKDADGKPVITTRLWDANAIEKVDDRTIRFNCENPQLAVPEHLFHYPALMQHPSQNGEWGVGAIGTGAFTAEVVEIGKRVVLKARTEGYWGSEGPYVDELHFIDHGDDPSAAVAALVSKQAHGQYEASVTQYEVLKAVPHLEIKEVTTAQTAVARMKVNADPFSDPRVRKAMRLAIDPATVLQGAHLNIGEPGEHHHVARLHPEYADVGFMSRDVEGAKKLLAEAGFPNGFETSIVCRPDPIWEKIAVEIMVQMWKDIGVTVNIDLRPSAQYWDVWDKVPFGFTVWSHRPLGVMVLGLAYRSGVPWNESSYSNPEFDALLTKAEGILDAKERSVVMADIEKLMLEDGPIVLPLWRGVFSFWDKSVVGFQHHPTSYIFGEELSLNA